MDWAAPIAAGAGFAGVVVACEPTGHRWKVVLQEAQCRGLAMVCVQPMLVARAREAEDDTGNKSAATGWRTAPVAGVLRQRRT